MTSRVHHIVLAAVAGLSCVAAPALGRPPAELVSVDPARVPMEPSTLPGRGNETHGTSVRWIVAAIPGAASDAIARASGATATAPEIGVFTADRVTATRFVGRLRAAGRFRYAEPDAPLHRRAFPADPLSPTQWWITPLVAPELTPPAPPPAAVIGIIEGGIDGSHPEFGGAPITVNGNGLNGNAHGTAVTSVASAPANGVGIVGMWPGAPTRVYADGETCSGAAAAVKRAAVDRISVINMSYGVGDGCFTHFVATQFAISRGTLPVAAAGNGGDFGERTGRPAGDPHVLSVGAINPDLSIASFTSPGEGVDLSAPGVDVVAAVPLSADEDGVADGYMKVAGTSFSAPIVTAAAAWVRHQRPGLTPAQTASLLRDSARDIGPPGRDDQSGSGVLDIAAALSGPVGVVDVAEPNDDVEWVNGRHFAKARPLLRGRSAQAVTATLDRFEDPVDVMPVWLAPRSRVRVTVVPARRTNVHLEVFSSGAKSVDYVAKPATLLQGSYRPGAQTERVLVENDSTRPRIVYVEVYVPSNASHPGAKYRLVLNRLR